MDAAPSLALAFGLQDGVVARRQLLELGLLPHDVKRLVRRRELVAVHPGVYVDHTGPLARTQREWAAVLAHWPAALTDRSALPAGADTVVHVAVDHRRTVRRLPGVRAHRTAGFAERVLWQRSPPRVAVEHAALDVAARLAASDRVAPAFAVLAETCQARVTTPGRLAETLHARTRVPARGLLVAMLDDLTVGADSVLERGYLHRVERPHGLPVGRRQHRVRADGRTRYTDVEYEGFGVVVELDGRAHHDGATARDRDAARDLDMLVARDTVTTRLTWGLVFDRPCATAGQVGRLLVARGWLGRVTACPACPACPA